MSAIFPGLTPTEYEPEPQSGYREHGLTYRHWFIIALMLLFNVIIFGCIFLAVLGRINWHI